MDDLTGTPPRKILYIHHGKGIGGAPLSLFFLIQQIDRRRFTPTVACLHDGAAFEMYRRAAGLETVLLPGVSDYSHTTLTWYGLSRAHHFVKKLLQFSPSVRQVREFLQTHPFDLVHLNSSTLYAAAIGAKQAGVPVVWHIREPLARGYFGLRRALLRQIIHRYADRVIAICENDAAQLRPSGRIRVVYNFVDFNQFDRHISGDAFRQEFGLSPDVKAVGMLGGVARPKGTLEFVQALTAVKQQIDGVKFFVIGNYPDKDKNPSTFLNRYYFRQIQKVIRTHNLQNQIEFIGVRRDIPQVLAGLDLLTFPSTVPHFARPIIEAGAMGKPVVASDLGGPRELVLHGETGLLVSPGQPRALAEAIVNILGDDRLARSMGEAGYQRAKKLFDAQTNAAATFAVYDEILNRQAPR